MYAKRLKRYLNQAVQWAERTGTDAYSKPKYAAPVAVSARKQRVIRLVRDSLGNEVVSNTTVYCQAATQPLDLIDGVEVISVGDWVERDGSICGYEVYL